MTASRPRVLVLTVAVGLVFGFVVASALQASGSQALPVPWTSLIAMIAIGVGVLAAAWPIRRWNQGVRDHPLDPLRAARTAVLAKAAAGCGAVLAGWFAGQALVLVGDLAIEPRRDRFLLALVATGCGLGVMLAGVLAQRWCRLPPEDPDDS